MALFWFLAGMLTALASLVVILPWLRTMPRLGALPVLPWQVTIGAAVIVAAVLGLYRWLGHPELAAPRGAPAPSIASGRMAGPTDNSSTMAGAATGTGASSMESAIASLEARLAKGGGSAGDWELLAKSFEFLGRPEDAAKARARQLPAPPMPGEAIAAMAAANAGAGSGAGSGAAGSGTTVSGEVSLAAALRARATPGATLFIVAKSVDSPGAPVAVYRSGVGTWPVQFTLDDSEAMLPGRNLSTAGRVTIEARISRSGQAQPAAGDLTGSSGVINPADHQVLKILIDQVVP